MLSHLILGFLRDGQPRHGYELITEYKTRSGNQVSAGNFYRELARLAERELVQTGTNPPDADARRIPYQITQSGRCFFDAWVIAPSRDDTDLCFWFLFIDRVPSGIRDHLLDRWQDDLWLRSKALARAREDAVFARDSRHPTAHRRLLASLISRRLRLVTADLEFLKEFRAEVGTWSPVSQCSATKDDVGHPRASATSSARQRRRMLDAGVGIREKGKASPPPPASKLHHATPVEI